MAVRSRITPHERIRRQAGFSVTGLARAIGVSHTYVSRVEAGDYPPSPRYRRTASALLGVSERELFPGVSP